MPIFKDGSVPDTIYEILGGFSLAGDALSFFTKGKKGSPESSAPKGQNYFGGLTDREERELEVILNKLEKRTLKFKEDEEAEEFKDKFTGKYLPVVEIFEKIMTWALERNESSFWQNREASFIKNNFLVFIAKMNGVSSSPEVERTETFEIKDDNAKGGFRKVTLKTPAPQSPQSDDGSLAEKFILRFTRSAQMHRNSFPKGNSKGWDKRYWDKAIRLTQQQYQHVPLRKVGDADFEGWVAKVTNFADDSLKTGAREYISERRRHRDTDGWFTKFMRSLQVK